MHPLCAFETYGLIIADSAENLTLDRLSSFCKFKILATSKKWWLFSEKWGKASILSGRHYSQCSMMVSIYMYTIYNQGYSPTSATFIYAPIQQLKQKKPKKTKHQQ